jgi:N-acetylmuramoyl-L-alanine amidase
MSHDPTGELTPRCLFLIAQSHHFLYHFHKSTRDSQEAITHYQLLLREFPNHSLADDAQYMLAIFHLDERSDQAAAYAELQRLVLHFPNSDMTPKAREKLAQLEKQAASQKGASREGGRKAPSGGKTAVGAGKKSPDSGKQPSMTASAKGSRKTGAIVPEQKSSKISRSAKPSGPAAADEPARAAAVTAKPPKAATGRKSKTGTPQPGAPTLAQQLCLGVGRIVLDPGHGGKDSGAISPSGLREKDIVLNIAKTLKLVLERETGAQVLLTRTTDRFLSLEERTAFANAQRADVFISIHANASENHSVGGVETYFLNLASDPQAARVAALENAPSKKRMSDLQSILKELVLKSKTNESSRLAHDIQNRIVTRLRERYKDVRDLGVKQAPFLVLVGAEMPCVLIETAFLSNEQEELRLADQTFQDTLSRGIAAGVASYIQQLSADRRESTASR